MCKALTDARLKNCQEAKAQAESTLKVCRIARDEALESLGNMINQYAEMESALSQCQGSLTTATGQVEELTAKLKPDFEIGEAPVHDAAWVRSVLAANLPNYPGGVWWWQMDDEYRPASDEEIIQYILWDDTNHWRYMSEWRDCDDFGLYFAARFRMLLGRNNCFYTIDWSGGHAYCVFLLRDGGIWIYEPQNDRWWVTGEHGFQMPYPLTTVGLVG